MNPRFPLVSILIPAYRPRFFPQALQSALAQDHSNLEIIVFDDSLDDAIGEITERLMDKRVLYIRNPKNRGFAGNFTQCFELASGEYVKFLNDDDLLQPNCVTSMADAFARHGPELKLVTSRRRIINEEGILQNDITATVPIAAMSRYIPGIELGNLALVNSLNLIGEPTTVMFRKSDVRVEGDNVFRLGANDYVCLADLSLCLRLLAAGDAYYFAEPLSFFRIHGNQEQNSPGVLFRCYTERYFLVEDARSLGFLRQPGQYEAALRAVGRKLREGLAVPALPLDQRREIERVYRLIPPDCL